MCVIYFCQFALSTLSFIFSPQRSHVHLLCLLPHVTFMSCDGLYDEEVRVDNGEQRDEVAKDGIGEHVASADPVLAQVVSAASGHVSLRHISAKTGNI